MYENSVSTSLQPAYILHYREFQESSYIVDAIALTHGRISLLAKGARNSRSQIRALYQPFRPLLLSWVGGGDLRTLTGIEESGNALDLQDVRLACAYYINELILRLLGKDQPHDEVFAFYALGLSQLEQQGIPYEATLRCFELQLLDVLGVLPDLPKCTLDGSDILPECEYSYHPANAVAVPVANEEGFGLLKSKHRVHNTAAASGGDRGDSSAAIHPDGHTPDQGVNVHGKTLLGMHALDFTDPNVLSECRVLMRRILQVQLGDRPLKSRELFTALAARAKR